MNKRQFSYLADTLTWGTLRIAGAYLLVGCLWILFSDKLAAQITSNSAMLTTISLYKGWAYVLVTAVLLYWLIYRHTTALRASAEQLHLVIDALPALISYVDTNKRYRFNNKAYEEWFGHTADGKLIEEVLGTPAYQTISQYVDKVLAGKTASYETEIPYKDGGTRFVNATYVPDIGANGRVKGFFALVQDLTERKQAEEELRRWADAFEGCAHGIAIDDPVTNRIMVCNSAFASMYKCRVEDMVGTAILSMYAPSDHERIRRCVEKADQIGHARFEAHVIRKDGFAFPVQMDVVSVLGDDGDLLYRVATAQDITERKQAEDALRESEARKGAILESALDGIISIDHQGKILEFNSAARAIFGCTLAEALGKEIIQLIIPPALREQHRLGFQRYLATGESDILGKRIELTGMRADESEFPVELSVVRVTHSNPPIFTGFLRDITSRKRAEEALRWNEQRFRALTENNWDAIALFGADGSILYGSPSTAQVLGYQLDEFVGRNAFELIHKDDQAFVTERLMQSLQQPGAHINVYARVLHKNGSWRWLEGVFTNLLDEPSVQAIVNNYHDFTERKQAEDALRASQEHLQRFSELSREAICIHDQGTILDVNPSGAALFGYTVEELIGKNVLIIAHPSSVGTALAHMQSHDPSPWEAIGVKKDGQTFIAEVQGRDIIYMGRPARVVFARDITDRKQAEKVVRENEERYRIIFELTNDYAYEDRVEPDGQIVPEWITSGVTRITGYTFEEMNAPDFWQRLVYPDDMPVFIQHAQRILSGQTDTAEMRIITKSGEMRWLKDSAHPLWDAVQGRVLRFYGAALDITERKRTEEELRESEQKFTIIYEKVPFASALSRLHDGAIIDVNEAFERVFGYTKQEVAGKTSLELGINPDSESRARISAELQARGSVRNMELTLVTKSGVARVFLLNMDLVGIGGQKYILQTAQDITERKQAEEALQKAHDELERKVQERTAALSQTNALLQALLDYTPDHIYFKDTQSRFIRNSRSQADMLGLSDPSEVVGKTDFDFFPHAAQAYAEEQEVMRSRQPLVDFEEWVIWPDGRKSWVSTTKVPLPNSEGEIIGIFGISRDITERKRAEEAVRQLNADLERQAAQLQSANKELEAFSYSVSHDLRAPLRAIDGYTRVLIEDYESILDSEGKRICGIISREAGRMGQLIDDLLTLSRLGRREMRSSKIDMKALACSIFAELIREEDRERIDFQVGKLPSLTGDPSLIRQVWVNLLSNAIKFTSGKKRSVIEVGNKQSKDEYVYYVRDNCAGFDMDYANKLFGVFQRLHSENEFEGTGVGLAIVQRVIHRHGGRVWAEGEVDKGATFYFALPRKRE